MAPKSPIKMKSKDELIEEMFAELQKKKAAILKAEKPKWETNCSFSYNQDGSGTRINLHVISDEDVITGMLSHLIAQKSAHEEAKKLLGTTGEFKWLSYTFDEWLLDFQTKIFKIQITQKKKEVERIEAALDKQVSPERKAELEFLQLQKDMANL